MFINSDTSRFRASFLIIPFLMPYLLLGNFVNTYTVPSGTVGSGEIKDYPPLLEALQLMTPGTQTNPSPVVVDPGGDSIFFARDRIRLTPGFRAKAG